MVSRRSTQSKNSWPTSDARTTTSTAQREGRLATTGPYAYVRHLQYVGFVAVLLGFLVQWPTLLTLAMFPVLAVMYARLARIEEREVRGHLGAAYDTYAAQIPRFIPRRGVRYVPPLALPVPGADRADAASGPAATGPPEWTGSLSERATAPHELLRVRPQSEP